MVHQVHTLGRETRYSFLPATLHVMTLSQSLRRKCGILCKTLVLVLLDHTAQKFLEAAPIFHLVALGEGKHRLLVILNTFHHHHELLLILRKFNENIRNFLLFEDIFDSLPRLCKFLIASLSQNDADHLLVKSTFLLVLIQREGERCRLLSIACG